MPSGIGARVLALSPKRRGLALAYLDQLLLLPPNQLDIRESAADDRRKDGTFAPQSSLGMEGELNPPMPEPHHG